MQKSHVNLVLLVACILGATCAYAQQAPVKALTAPQIAPAPQQAQKVGPLGSASIAQPMPMPLPQGAFAPVDLKKEAIDQVAPLSVKEILELRKELEDRSDAMSEPMRPVPKPVRRQVQLDLSPNSPPPVIRTTYGQGTVVSFIDSAGRPWPVEIGNGYSVKNFSVEAFGNDSVSIGAKRPGVLRSNVILRLVGLPSKVSFTVTTDQEESDYSVDYQLGMLNPNIPAPVGDETQKKALGLASLMDYLYNTPPKSARLLTVTAPGFIAWQTGPDRMIVRTDALVASPAWSRRQSSTSGTTVYDLPLTPVITISKGGQESNILVAGFEATVEQK